MRPSIYTTIRLFVAIATILVVVGHCYLPLQSTTIHPMTSITPSIYGYADPEGGCSVSWLSESKHEWRCDYKSRHGPSHGCGFSLNTYMVAISDVQEWSTVFCQGEGIAPLSNEEEANPGVVDGIDGIDFSKYKGLNIKIDYEGRAPRLRLYLRNYNPSYSKSGDIGTSKFMSAFIRTEDLKAGVAYVSLSEFSVAEWWIAGHDIPRDLAAPELSNIISMGVDHVEYGIHKVRVEKIELIGERIKLEQLLFYIILFWVIFLSIEGLIRYTLRGRVNNNSKKIEHLTTLTQQVEAEKNALEVLSWTDSLTGIFNKSGITQYANNFIVSSNQSLNLGVLILDVDHFKRINSKYGYDTGDSILKTFTSVITANIRDQDVLSRWSGEEFVLICPQSTTRNLMIQAEKLRKLVSEYAFEPALGLNITISIGATLIGKSDVFEDAFKRADTALYRAKLERNCVVYES